MKKAYLGGPGVFLKNASDYFAKKKDIALKYDIQGMSPFDTDNNYDHRPAIERGLSFSAANEKLMRESNIMIADLTPFRSISMDVGTAYEIGYMRALNRQVYGYSNATGTYLERFLQLTKQLSSVSGNSESSYYTVDTSVEPARIYDSNGMVVENFGMTDNLMIHGAIILGNGAIFHQKCDEEDMFTNLEMFEKVCSFIRDNVK